MDSEGILCGDALGDDGAVGERNLETLVAGTRAGNSEIDRRNPKEKSQLSARISRNGP
jgi:hypothetical protein